MNSTESTATGSAPPKLQRGVAIGALVMFVALVVFMLATVGGNATKWERQVYVFGAVEAIVFTVVGWIFGREVHRGEAEVARKDVVAAQHEAAAAHATVAEKQEAVLDLTERFATEVSRGRALHAAIKTASAAPAAAAPRTSGPRDVSEGPPPATRAAAPAADPLASLRALADALYEDDE